MNDASQTAVASPATTISAPTTNGARSRDRVGIVARGEQQATEAIAEALIALGFTPRNVDVRPIPFEGTWGLATSAAYGLANEAVTRDLEASGQLDGLSKKEAKALASGAP